MAKNKQYLLDLFIITETEKALLVTQENLDAEGRKITHWLPKSQVEGEAEVGKSSQLLVSSWIAERAGLDLSSAEEVD